VTAEDRTELVVRRLTLRLEEVAVAVEHGSTGDAVARLLDLASVATEHAISLELLTEERAAAVWAAARARHPALATFEKAR
jgi:hypothetical protein